MPDSKFYALALYATVSPSSLVRFIFLLEYWLNLRKRNIFNKVRNTGIKEHGTFDLHFKITRECDENNKKHII